MATAKRPRPKAKKPKTAIEVAEAALEARRVVRRAEVRGVGLIDGDPVVRAFEAITGVHPFRGKMVDPRRGVVPMPGAMDVAGLAERIASIERELAAADGAKKEEIRGHLQVWRTLHTKFEENVRAYDAWMVMHAALTAFMSPTPEGVRWLSRAREGLVRKTDDRIAWMGRFLETYASVLDRENAVPPNRALAENVDERFLLLTPEQVEGALSLLGQRNKGIWSVAAALCLACGALGAEQDPEACFAAKHPARDRLAHKLLTAEGRATK